MTASEVNRLLPSPEEVRAAARRIAPAIRETPFYKSETLSEFLGGDVWLKLESEQNTGSFKIRGATNALATLSDDERARGVITASAGNHGLGIATAAQAMGVKLTVYVPRTAPSIKRDRIAKFGVTVDASAAKYDDAEKLARAHAARTGATFVSPCAGRQLLAGQGTVALEILEALPSMRSIIVPVGGAGLAGGIAGLLRAEAPTVRIVGAQSERTNAMTIAMRTGEPTDIPDLPTLADGLSGEAAAEMLAQAQASLDDIVASSEEDIVSAIAYLWIEEGFKVEGAGAVGVAALLSGRVESLEFPVVVVVTGGNIDDDKHKAALSGE
ncbi:MAG TPA: threonine/serine dehydratase [Gemmatimonadaceae bacterium]|jgi:threonine dehydratase